MKTKEMMVELFNSPKDEFISEIGNTGNTVIASIKGDVLNLRNEDGQLISHGLSLYRTWKKVKKSVTWQEAFEHWSKGGGFTIHINGCVYVQSRWNRLGVFNGDESNGFYDGMFEEGKFYLSEF